MLVTLFRKNMICCLNKQFKWLDNEEKGKGKTMVLGQHFYGYFSVSKYIFVYPI